MGGLVVVGFGARRREPGPARRRGGAGARRRGGQRGPIHRRRHGNGLCRGRTGAYRLGGEAAGAVLLDQQRDDIADALVVDGGVHGVAAGAGDALEVGQDDVLDLLARGRHDGDAADGRAARARTGDRDVHVDRRGHLDRDGVFLFPLLRAAQSRHRFPHSHASGSARTARSGSMVLPLAVGFRFPGVQVRLYRSDTSYT
ncbi:hypothetical protein [Streptomyces chartreusis]|uniref:hypothetical protein n=1 Tax=Streptomyces chartreusis TaxID=1969 RepID=UPI0036643D4C